jgi:hypothetical protein
MNDEKNHCNRDARIGYVESGPRMRVGNVQIEKEKIDHMSIKETIGKISQDASQQERKRYVAPKIRRMPSHEEGHNDEKRDKRNDDEQSIVVPERPKRCAGICDVYQSKETRYHSTRLVGANEPQDHLFRPLIKGVERKREKENEFHPVFLSFRAQRSGVEESPTANLMARVRRAVRDVWTSLDMTKKRLTMLTRQSGALGEFHF